MSRMPCLWLCLFLVHLSSPLPRHANPLYLGVVFHHLFFSPIPGSPSAQATAHWRKEANLQCHKSDWPTTQCDKRSVAGRHELVTWVISRRWECQKEDKGAIGRRRRWQKLRWECEACACVVNGRLDRKQNISDKNGFFCQLECLKVCEFFKII